MTHCPSPLPASECPRAKRLLELFQRLASVKKKKDKEMKEDQVTCGLSVNGSGSVPTAGYTHRVLWLIRKCVSVRQLTFALHVTKGNTIFSHSEGSLASRAANQCFVFFYSFRACLRSRVLWSHIKWLYEGCSTSNSLIKERGCNTWWMRLVAFLPLSLPLGSL